WMVIGSEQITVQYQHAWEKGEAATLDELAGVPPCCQDAHKHLRQTGQSDPVWPLMTAHQPTAGPEVDVHSPPTLNILLRPLGINLLGYQPCNLSCEESRRFGDTLIALGR